MNIARSWAREAVSGRLSPGERDGFADQMEAIAQRSDRAAFASLFAYYAPRLKSYMQRLGAEPDLAEELAQEVMITVWRKAALFDRQQASVSTWIFRIARNRRIDAFRRTKTVALDPEEPSLIPDSLDEPDRVFEMGETESRVRAALLELPQDQIVLLQQAFYEGLSHSEIAERQGLPLGTVKSRIRLAFQKLRARLDGER